MPLQLLFAAASAVVGTGLAARTSWEEHSAQEADLLKLRERPSHEICGGTQIWELITGAAYSDYGPTPTPLEMAANIEWERAAGYKDAYVERMMTEPARLESERKRLKAELKKLPQTLEKERQSLPPTGTKEHMDLLNAALGEPSFGGAEAAYAGKCGRARMVQGGIEVPVSGYDRAVEAFESLSRAFFENRVEKKAFRLDGVRFLRDCQALVVKGDDDLESFCPQMCQAFKDSMDRVHQEAAGAAEDTLKLQIQELKLQLRPEALKELSKSVLLCNWDWVTLHYFRKKLAHLSERHKASQEQLRRDFEASEALRDKLRDQENDGDAKRELERLKSQCANAEKDYLKSRAALEDAYMAGTSSRPSLQ